MKKSAAALAAAVAVLALGLLSGTALAGDHHGGDHGSQAKQGHASGSAQTSSGTSDSQPGQKPGPHTQKNTTCATGGGQGTSATCSSDTSSKSDASKRYGNGKTAAQIANGKGAPSGTPITGPGNSQPHKICGRDVHAFKGGDCSKQNNEQEQPKQQQPSQSQQTVTFCDMDSATTGELQTKSSVDLLDHEFDGNPEETRDIVPPFTFSGPTFTTKDGRTYVAGQAYSQMWNSATEAIFNAGCNEQQPPPKAQVHAQVQAQQVTFCDMDSSTTGTLETKPADKVARHEFDGNPEENRDIVPPFTFNGQTLSENWDANGQAIFHNDCTAPAGTQGAAQTPPSQAPAAPPAAPAQSAPAQSPPPAQQAVAAAATTTPTPPPSPASGVKGASKTIAAPASHRSSGVLGAAKTLGSSATSGTLPFTGLRLWIVELVALGLIGGGVAMRLIARRRPN